MAVGSKSDSRQGNVYIFVNFQGKKSETAMAHKNEM